MTALTRRHEHAGVIEQMSLGKQPERSAPGRKNDRYLVKTPD
jgi:hypothetical protein